MTRDETGGGVNQIAGDLLMAAALLSNGGHELRGLWNPEDDENTELIHAVAVAYSDAADAMDHLLKTWVAAFPPQAAAPEGGHP